MASSEESAQHTQQRAFDLAQDEATLQTLRDLSGDGGETVATMEVMEADLLSPSPQEDTYEMPVRSVSLHIHTNTNYTCRLSGRTNLQRCTCLYIVPPSMRSSSTSFCLRNLPLPAQQVALARPAEQAAPAPSGGGGAGAGAGPPGDTLEIRQATHPYVAQDEDELSFQKGETIYVRPIPDPEEEEDGWLYGSTVNGKSGVFPANFTQPG